MKKYFKELIILVIQILIFYISPLFMTKTSPLGMIFFILSITCILSIIIASISNNRIKFLYPIIISIAFIPTVYIYYNESALIHSVWYLVVSLIGIVIGTIINKIMNKSVQK